jgi:hypothetical protein
VGQFGMCGGNGDCCSNQCNGSHRCN